MMRIRGLFLAGLLAGLFMYGPVADAAVRIQLRRDTAANWTAVNPVLAQGEPGCETDTGKCKIGDGTSTWSVLPYYGGDASALVISNDTTTNATEYPTWTTGTTGLLPIKVSSTKMTFNPSLGAFTLNGSLNLGEGTNVVAGTTTGTKIGTATTQKLGFFNSVPIVKPTGSLLTAVGNLGLVATPTIAATDLSSGQVALARGGTAADLSATGPGYLRQKTAGAGVTVGSTFVDAGLYVTPGTNCTAGLQALFNSVPSGTTIVLPGGECQISDTITIGNGTASSLSTLQNIKITGQATAASGWWSGAGGTATTLKWIGTTGKAMIHVLGPIGGFVLENLYLDGGVSPGADTLLWLTHLQSSEIHNVNGQHWGVQAYLVDSWGYPANPPSQNVLFLNVGADNCWSHSADGLVLGTAVAAGSGGTSGFYFVNCTFRVYPGLGWGGTGHAIKLRFTDSIVFTNVYFPADGTGVGVLAPSDSPGFPMDIVFYACPGGIDVIPTTPVWQPPRNQSIQFLPFLTDDAEPVPNVDGIGGFSDNGVMFGKWTFGQPRLGAATVGNLTVSDLPVPDPLFLSYAGTPGTTSYSYACVAKLADGTSSPAAVGSMANGNAVLNATNYNNVSCAASPGAWSFDFYRTASGGTPATTGKINTSPVMVVKDNIRVGMADTGLAGDGTQPPAIQSTGFLALATGATVASGTKVTATGQVFAVSGTAAIATIDVPWAGTFTGPLVLIPTGAWTTNTTGNIALASTAVVNKAMIMTYVNSKWYPSY